jgi:hypothetical protein
MSPHGVRLLEHIHGHVSWLATLALLHPAILLRKPRRRALWAAGLATLLCSVGAAIGAVIYGEYRAQIKPLLFAEAPSLGWAFERKEHLGTAVVMLAWTGFAAHVAVGPSPTENGDGGRWARLAHAAYVAAAAAALVAAGLGMAVACQRSFG